MKYTKETLLSAVGKSISVMGVLRELGVSQHSGGMHYYISRKIKEYQIDTSHFLGIRTNSGNKHKGGNIKKKNYADILILRSCGAKEKSHILRRALLESGREEKCEICGQGNIWCGKKLVLQVDHKNGNNLDNRPENLRFACPNCHTQTGNYAIIKNKREKLVCQLCGVGIQRRNKSGCCYKCSPRLRGAIGTTRVT